MQVQEETGGVLVPPLGQSVPSVLHIQGWFPAWPPCPLSGWILLVA